MQIFKSRIRIGKARHPKAPTREPHGVQFLLARVRSGAHRQTGGAVLAFTSVNPGEGVSHVVQFFADKLAVQTGKPTLVVNAERLAGLRVSDLMDKPGMRTTVANPGSVPGTAAKNGNGNGNGASTWPDPETLAQLESKTGLDLIQALGPQFGYTLIDCPSISTSYEAAVLAPEVDGVVLVVEADRTKRDQILRARHTIEMAKGTLMGMVLNRRRHVVPEWVYRRI